MRVPASVLLVPLAFQVLLVACAPVTLPLSNTRDSSTAVAQDVIDAMSRGDTQILASLALSESEFRDHVWPELPASRPERNLPFSYVWGDLRQKSAASLGALVARHRGRPYTLVAIRFSEVTPYATYTVHRKATFVVRRPDGENQDLRLCGSMLEQAGRWKVFSYVVDD